MTYLDPLVFVLWREQPLLNARRRSDQDCRYCTSRPDRSDLDYSKGISPTGQRALPYIDPLAWLNLLRLVHDIVRIICYPRTIELHHFLGCNPYRRGHTFVYTIPHKLCPGMKNASSRRQQHGLREWETRSTVRHAGEPHCSSRSPREDPGYALTIRRYGRYHLTVDEKNSRPRNKRITDGAR